LCTPEGGGGCPRPQEGPRSRPNRDIHATDRRQRRSYEALRTMLKQLGGSRRPVARVGPQWVGFDTAPNMHTLICKKNSSKSCTLFSFAFPSCFICLFLVFSRVHKLLLANSFDQVCSKHNVVEGSVLHQFQPLKPWQQSSA